MNSTEDQRNDIALPGLFALHVEPEHVVIREEGSSFAEALSDALGCTCAVG